MSIGRGCSFAVTGTLWFCADGIPKAVTRDVVSLRSGGGQDNGVEIGCNLTR